MAMRIERSATTQFITGELQDLLYKIVTEAIDYYVLNEFSQASITTYIATLRDMANGDDTMSPAADYANEYGTNTYAESGYTFN